MIDFVLQNLVPLLEVLLVFLVGVLLMGVKKLPGVLLKMAKAFEVEAKKTKGQTDDLAAKVLVAFAQALVGAVEKELGTGKSPSRLIK